MTNLNLDLHPDDYTRLEEEAVRQGKRPELLVQEWIAERLQQLNNSFSINRLQSQQILRAAGLLTELGPTLQKMADSSISLEEVKDAMSRDKAQSLSQIVLEQRDPKI